MAIEIKRYGDFLKEVWDNFIENLSLNGTFLHTRKFYDHNTLNRTDDQSYLFYKKNKLVAVIPCSLYVNDDKKILHSYLRATYGGFVISKEVGMEEAIEMVDTLIDEAKRLSVDEIIIRNPFRIFYSQSSDETDYAMWYRGFSIKYRELEIAIQLNIKSNAESNYTDSTKRNIQKGKKTLVVVESEDYEKYWQLLNKNLADKHAANPTHSHEDFLSLLNNITTKKIKLFVALLNGEMIAGIVVFIVNTNAIHAQYIASDHAFQEYRPLNVLIDHIIGWGCDHNFKYFNLGMGNEDNGKKLNYGLFKFKEGFGGRGILRETMHLQLTPVHG